MRLFRLLLCFLACGFTATAYADTVDYNISFFLSNSAPTGSGTFSGDSTTGNLTAADFFVFDETFTLAGAGSTPTYDGSDDLAYNGVDTTDGYGLHLNIGFFDFIDRGFGPLGGGTYSVTEVTPEPASFALLGAGILGMAGLLRRRFV